MRKLYMMMAALFLFISSATAEITQEQREQIIHHEDVVQGFFMEDFEKAFATTSINVEQVYKLEDSNAGLIGKYGDNTDIVAHLQQCELEFFPQFCSGALIYVTIHNIDGSKNLKALEDEFWWAIVKNRSDEYIELVIPLSLAYVEYDVLENWMHAIMRMVDYITGEAKS
ncbi:MAG: hypothetical protein ACK5MJ_04460 [Alphaproteobacteria bacterium]